MKERSGMISCASFMTLRLVRFVGFSRRRHVQVGKRCADLRGRRYRNQTPAIERVTPVVWGSMLSSDPNNPVIF